MPSKGRRLGERIAERVVVVVDTETTGLGHLDRYGPRPDGVVQVGYAYRDARGRVEQWSQTCNPGPEYLAGGRARTALAINGISPQTVLRAPKAREVAKVLHRRLGEVEEKMGHPLVLRSYNRAFDEPFLRANPWKVPSDWWGSCIMVQAANHLNGPGGRWLKLEHALARLGLRWPAGAAHTAAVDAHAALLVHEALGGSW